jgi:hypothetical protein
MLKRSLQIESIIAGVASGTIDKKTAQRQAVAVLYGHQPGEQTAAVDVVLADIFDQVCRLCGFEPIEVENGPGTIAFTDVRRFFALVVKQIYPDMPPSLIAKKIKRDRSLMYRLWQTGYNYLQHDPGFRAKYEKILQSITIGAHDQNLEH